MTEACFRLRSATFTASRPSKYSLMGAIPIKLKPWPLHDRVLPVGRPWWLDAQVVSQAEVSAQANMRTATLDAGHCLGETTLMYELLVFYGDDRSQRERHTV